MVALHKPRSHKRLVACLAIQRRLHSQRHQAVSFRIHLVELLNLSKEVVCSVAVHRHRNHNKVEVYLGVIPRRHNRNKEEASSETVIRPRSHSRVEGFLAAVHKHPRRNKVAVFLETLARTQLRLNHNQEVVYSQTSEKHNHSNLAVFSQV